MEWDVLEISLPSGSVRTMVAGGGASMYPDWAPTGNHFLFATTRYGGWAIEDMSFKERFTRRLVESAELGDVINDPRWAPDGNRFVFTLKSSAGQKLMLSNVAGGRLVEVDREAGAAAWSPDGQWIVYQRIQSGKRQLAKIRPGSAPVPLASIIGTRANKDQTQWSPAGDWILFNTPDGFSLISPEGHNERTFTTRKFLAYGFSKDGSQFLGIFQNTNPDGAEWQLYSVDVKTSAERLIGAVDLPVSTNTIRGFSLNPDGKSFLTSIAKWPFDIWMLEGWDQQPTALSRFFRRKAAAQPPADAQPRSRLRFPPETHFFRLRFLPIRRISSRQSAQ
jgi:Tol biopolymer transport system component